MKNNKTFNLLFFDFAFWGLLAALWVAGVWKIYYTTIEQVALETGIPEVLFWIVTVVIVSGIFLIFRKRIHMFYGDARRIATARHRGKKK